MPDSGRRAIGGGLGPPRWRARALAIAAAVLPLLLATRGVASSADLRLLIDSPTNDYAPAWSPDGREILFFSWRDGTRDLWVVPSAGGEPRRLESGPWVDEYAAWSPDGKTIAYTVEDPPTAKQDILLLDVGGTFRPLVTHPAQDYHPRWSPDGRRIAFTSNRLGTPDIWIVGTADGDSARLLIGGPTVEAYASWTPDGSRVLFQSDRSGNMGIWTAPFRDGACGEAKPITAGDGFCSHPSWSGSASRVAFTRKEGRRRALLVADVDSLGGAGAARAVPLPDSLSVSYPEWSPDGRSIAFCAYVSSGSKIWIVSDSLGFAAYQDRDAPRRK